MSQYFHSADRAWIKATVRGTTAMDKSVVHEGSFDMRSAFFRMPEGMSIPRHMHSQWVQVVVMEGLMEVESDADGVVRVEAGGCYFIDPGETHKETAVVDTLVMVTQGEDRAEFLTRPD